MKLLSLFAAVAVGICFSVIPSLACGDDADCDGSKCSAKHAKHHKRHSHQSRKAKTENSDDAAKSAQPPAGDTKSSPANTGDSK